QLAIGQDSRSPRRHQRVEEVVRSGLAGDRQGTVSAPEVCTVPSVTTVELVVEEVNLLCYRWRNARVLGKVRVQRSSACLLGADDEEVGESPAGGAGAAQSVFSGSPRPTEMPSSDVDRYDHPLPIIYRFR